jgi:hypothetical protein
LKSVLITASFAANLSNGTRKAPFFMQSVAITLPIGFCDKSEFFVPFRVTAAVGIWRYYLDRRPISRGFVGVVTRDFAVPRRAEFGACRRL